MSRSQFNKEFKIQVVKQVLEEGKKATKVGKELELSPNIENEALTKVISEVYQQYKKRYGYRRITAELRSRGIKVNHKRIYTRKVVGWSMDKTMNVQLAIDALQAAV